MIPKKHINQFNTPDTIMVITSYPDPKHGIEELNAVAWHAQKTVRQLARKTRVIVLAEELDGKPVYKDHENVLVIRCWKRGSLFSLWNLVPLARVFTQVRSVLLQFEFNIFGGMLPVLMLPFVLSALRLLGKQITFEIHQVITDIKVLSNHINIHNPVVQWLFNCGLHGFYWVMGLLSQKILVFEEELKHRLEQYVPSDHIHVLPLSVESKQTLPSEKAKEMIGVDQDSFVVLAFGFVNWYKGSDWIVKMFAEHPQKKITLLLAGGQNPTLKDKGYYQEFFEQVRTTAARYKRIVLTGFVPDSQVKRYFSAADLVVLPYRTFMSASGPFSLALSYRKPVLLSNRLLKYSDTQDIADALGEAGLSRKDVFFPMSSRGLFTLLKRAQTEEAYYTRLLRFTTVLARKRSISRVTTALCEVVAGVGSRTRGWIAGLITMADNRS